MPENNNIERWMKLSEWRGKTVQALEDMNKELNEIKGDIKEMNKKLDKINGRITNIQVKVAGIGGTIAIISSLILHLIFPVV